MAIIARLAGEGIGPFKSFDFDFSDPEGNPHPGPHIFAGINGSGKSTVLRTLAWLLESCRIEAGFQWQQWQHLLEGYGVSRAMMVLTLSDKSQALIAQTTDVAEGWSVRLNQWLKALLTGERFQSLQEKLYQSATGVWPTQFVSPDLFERKPCGYLLLPDWKPMNTVLAAAYGPSRLLRHLAQVDLSLQLEHFRAKALSFEATVQNEAIQSWLVGLFSKRAIARERGENLARYSTVLAHFENALKLICDQDVTFGVDIEPSLQPRLLMYGKRLDFSQLPDGVRSTVGWLADFLMRMDTRSSLPDTEPGFLGLIAGKRPSISRAGPSYVLLLDEIDAHLHPRWQRSILPSLKKAMPEVQVFATSHSPFVISSCPGARIHVLELNEQEGVARNRPPVDAPIGESILATIKDIFGVSSRFDIETERLLDEWNELHKGQAKGTLSAKENERITELTRDLSERSEELRQIVSPVVSINDSLVASLKSQAQSGELDQKRKSRRG